MRATLKPSTHSGPQSSAALDGGRAVPSDRAHDPARDAVPVPEREGGTMKFQPSDKPEARIEQQGEHYYVLIMGEREMGGTNKSALASYARKLGYKIVAQTSTEDAEAQAEANKIDRAREILERRDFNADRTSAAGSRPVKGGTYEETGP